MVTKLLTEHEVLIPAQRPELAGQQNGLKAKLPAALTEHKFDEALSDDSDEGLLSRNGCLLCVWALRSLCCVCLLLCLSCRLAAVQSCTCLQECPLTAAGLDDDDLLAGSDDESEEDPKADDERRAANATAALLKSMPVSCMLRRHCQQVKTGPSLCDDDCWQARWWLASANLWP